MEHFQTFEQFKRAKGMNIKHNSWSIAICHKTYWCVLQARGPLWYLTGSQTLGKKFTEPLTFSGLSSPRPPTLSKSH